MVIPGESREEILFHSVVCHPSLANDELSGVTLAVYLARYVQGLRHRRYSYRFVFVPETIGAIVYINKNFDALKRHCLGGYILSCEGDNNGYSYLPTITGDALADRAAKYVLEEVCPAYKRYTFLERGADERQYNAPGVDLKVCLVCRTKAETFKEYHTSDDNMELVSPEGFEGSFQLFKRIITLLEMNLCYKSTVLCEPRLGAKGLYSEISRTGSKDAFRKYIDFIAYADGNRDLIEIGTAIGVGFTEIAEIVPILQEKGLIRESKES